MEALIIDGQIFEYEDLIFLGKLVNFKQIKIKQNSELSLTLKELEPEILAEMKKDRLAASSYWQEYKIKDGVSSSTHRNISPSFVPDMDNYKTIERNFTHSNGNIVATNGYSYRPDWLEPIHKDDIEEGKIILTNEDTVFLQELEEAKMVKIITPHSG